MNYNDAVKQAFESAAWYAKQAANLASETRFLQLDLTVVSSIDVSETSISIYLDSASNREAQREFIHCAAQVFEVKDMEKTPNWNKSSLCASGRTSDDKYLTISGYVPPTCELVEVEEPVSDWQIKRAESLLATRTVKVKKVVCS